MPPDERAPPGAKPAGEQLLDIIAAMLRELRPGAPSRALHLDDRLERDLALDSLSRMELAVRVEAAFDVQLPGEAASRARTPRELLNAIAAARAGPAAPAFELPLATPPAAPAGAADAASTLVEAIAWHVERHSDRLHATLIDADHVTGTLTYGQLWARAQDVACGLAARGIGPGDTVALMLPTGADFLEVFLAAMLVRAIPVPLYPPTRWSQIETHVVGRTAILANAQARLLVTDPRARFVGRLARPRLPDLREVLTVEALRRSGGPVAGPGAAARDVAMLQYTSGSTGDPKGVVLTHANLLANIRAMGAAAQATSADRFVSWLPLYHDMGLIGAWLGSLYFAIPLTLMTPQSFLARPVRWLQVISRARATMSAGPNFAYEIVASKVRDEDLAGVDLSAWRLAFNGAEPVRAATLARFADRFAAYGFDRRAMTPVYGLAESAVGLAFPPLGRGPRVDRIDARALARGRVANIAGSACAAVQEVVACGLPLPGHAIRIIDSLGGEAAPRVEGRVEFRGPSGTSGYWRNAEGTARLHDGAWLDTGDLGYMAEGELFVTSRSKDVIKRGGHNIHPYDLEAAIGDIPGIRKGCVAAFGSADAATGTERVVVVAETSAPDAAARRGLEASVASVAQTYLDAPPDEVLLVAPRTVPKTSSGKIRRSACRELYEEGVLQAPRRAVWWQVLRLVAGSYAASARRSLHAALRMLYGLYAWSVLVAIAAAGLAGLAVLPSPHARARFVHVGARLLLRLLAIRIEVAHADPAAPPARAVFVANHASYVDAIVLAAVLPARVRFTAKRDFARTPILGYVLRRLDGCFVDRTDGLRGAEDTREVSRAVSSGASIVFFPEGTFTRAPGLAAFHLGAFSVATATAAPVVPVALRGTRAVLRDGAWMPQRHAIHVAIGAIDAPDGTDWSAAVRLRDRARAVILEGCGEPDLGT